MPRRTVEQRIQDLEAKIQSIKERAERKKVRTDPTVRHMKASLKLIDKAMAATTDQVLRKSLGEARANVSACLSLCGVKVAGGRSGVPAGRRATGAASVSSTENGPSYPQPDPNDLLTYLKKNPGSRSETISAAFSTDAIALRPVMRELIDGGRVRTEGERRGRRYFVRT